MNYSVYLQFQKTLKNILNIKIIKMWILNIIIKRNYWTRKKACFKPLRFTLISGSVGRISHGTSMRTHPRHCQML